MVDSSVKSPWWWRGGGDEAAEAFFYKRGIRHQAYLLSLPPQAAWEFGSIYCEHHISDEMLVDIHGLD
jgi:hypothetical protein